MRCTYCLRKIKDDLTYDHVFPDAWYPDSTPDKVQRWTVPSCRKCNAKFQVAEDELFIRWGICVEPGLEACMGINERAIKQQFFIETKDPRKFGRKLAVFKKITSRMGQYDPKRTHIGFAPKLGVRGTLAVITPNKFRSIFSEKLARGTEFKLREKLIPWKKRIGIYYEMADDSMRQQYDIWNNLLIDGQTVNLGPGFNVRWAVNPSNPEQSLYRFEIWGHIKFYSLVYPKTISYELTHAWYAIKDYMRYTLNQRN